MLEEFPNSSKNRNTFAAWIRCDQSTTKMSTGFSTRKMRRGTARSLSSAVPRTTAQRSTLRSSQSAVPRTTARTSTLSAEQRRLREVAACLPVWYSYGNEQPVRLLHPRVTTLREECQPATTASSPAQHDDNASSSSILLEMPTSTCRSSEQPLTGTLHQKMFPLFRCSLFRSPLYTLSDLNVLVFRAYDNPA